MIRAQEYLYKLQDELDGDAQTVARLASGVVNRNAALNNTQAAAVRAHLKGMNEELLLTRFILQQQAFNLATYINTCRPT